ncbi:MULTISPECIES: ArsR family transcriptional regulator [unclassified Haladaptatus]|uniref:DUF7351 domain-containing protein n=1 Tax=unclassified Haladaptatus TaxID=2622732 RepID=UPI00209C21A2|nr:MULTISPECIES: ArsR family transcriptional regulator [unclassified Haladaptatus]MCO8246281.1 ArsR family transcriptional regulator [Haladaptatus sp. AB643]MCO8255183.1 ArsR family transcriptional regulator [Haladaptatus sp. AB618]
MTFTELKDAVGMRDSGGFQYHLNALDGTFLRKTDDGYTHLAGGIALYRAMLGSVMGPDAIDPIPLDERCPNCESPLELRYDHQVFYAYCPTCDESVSNAPYPPAGLENRSDDDRIGAFDRWTRRLVVLLRDGICPWCASTVSHEIGIDGGEIEITHTCDRCRGFLRTSIIENVIDHPAVVSFCYDHGVDITTVPHWRFDEISKNVDTRVVSEDPNTVWLTLKFADDEQTVSVDEGMSVREVRK